MIKKQIAIFLLMLSLLFQTGCWDQKIIEQIGFMLQMGYELDGEGNILYSVTLPTVEEEVESEVVILSTTANLLREGRDQLRTVSGKRIEGGKIQHIHFSRELAEKGILDYLQIFVRNSENPLIANVLINEGSPKEMFEASKEYNDKPRIAFYVTNLLESARMDGYAPDMRLHNFLTLFYSGTIDPIMPYIRFNEETVEIAGTALFSGDKMVGSINIQQSGLLSLLMNKSIDFTYIYDPQTDGDREIRGSALKIGGLKHKIDVSINKKIPEVNMKLSLKGVISEFMGERKLDDDEFKKKLEETLAESIQKDMMEIIDYIKEIGSDPLGIEEILRSKHNEYYKSIKFKDIYTQVNFKLEVEVLIEVYGAIT